MVAIQNDSLEIFLLLNKREVYHAVIKKQFTLNALNINIFKAIFYCNKKVLLNFLVIKKSLFSFEFD